jgi:hypothetical protein
VADEIARRDGNRGKIAVSQHELRCSAKPGERIASESRLRKERLRKRFALLEGGR